MSNNNYWGMITWYLLHGLCRKIKPTHFNELLDSFINIFIDLLNNLPCPECSLHSIQFISTVNFQNIKNKDDLETIVFELHNHSNKHINKPLEDKSILKMYDKLNLPKTIISFKQVFNTKGNMSLLTQSYHRSIFLNKFNKWFESHKQCFDI